MAPHNYVGWLRVLFKISQLNKLYQKGQLKKDYKCHKSPEKTMGKLCHGERDWGRERKKHGGRTLDIRKMCCYSFIF